MWFMSSLKACYWEEACEKKDLGIYQSYFRSLDQLLTECRPTVGRQLTECWLSIDRVSTVTATDIAVDITYSKHDPITECVNALSSDLNFEAQIAKHKVPTARLQSKIPKPHWD